MTGFSHLAIADVGESVGTQVMSMRGCISCMIRTFHIMLHKLYEM